MAKANIYSLGGTVQASKGTYLKRQADEKLLELCQQAEFAYILTSRQMGKSSLMISTASELKKVSVKSVIIDLTGIGTQVSAEQWYLGILLKIEEELMLDTDVEQWWQANSNVGVTQRLTKFFQHILLEEVTSRVVIFVDEIDTTLSLDFTDDFFAAIRYFYVARAQNAKFERLSFVLIGVATPGDLIRDPKRTPFNIGQRLDLTDFTFEEAIPLADGLGLPTEQAQQLLKWVLEWTGGHPYLTQRLCSVISQQNKDSWSSAALEEVVSSTFFGAMSQQDNNLQFVRDMLTKRAPNKDQVLTVYREIHLGRHPVIDEEQSIIKSHLKLSGVVRREDNTLRVRNRIYQQVFNTEWVENELGQLRPYSQALTAWLETNREDESRLLRGQALQDALDWAKDKTLSDDDYRFLAASQELDKREIQFALAETKKEAQQIVADAERNAKRITRIGLGILSVAILGAVGAGWYAQKLIQDAQTATALERQGNSALQLFNTYQIDALILAMDAGEKLQKLVGKNTPIEKYPVVTSPIVALNGILDHIHERNQLKSHTELVRNANFSPDGKQIVTASSDKTAKVWDNQGKLLATLSGHTELVRNANFSPDGKQIVTASYDNTAKVWQHRGLEELLNFGCEWLHDYLIINPEELQKLEVCQTPSTLKAAAPFLVKVGEEKAKAGNVEEAVATFKTALEWNKELKFDPHKKAQELASKVKAERKVSEGKSLVKDKKIKEAIAAYNEAQKLDPQVEISAKDWNSLCLKGSLHQSAKEVIFACEKAVKLAPNDGAIRDSRGLARALTGDYQGAIADFEAYIAQTNDKDMKAQRQGWVQDLRVGKNPFTKDVLKKLDR
ncbi:AAA-like domain-containing protein [Aetokthonos hydrillicola Thurmond2011]|uniref:AAA-like domain-containing protein n=2 Tax=Aetokthonos TaxID=1550243 RepID=A0AAP5MBN9_9CYAN|nr:AAA-like domain-containing protein [Aetokthonos hydrillicola]MBO3461610.1 hypothetical protein [Aetokthonos hydrillicola CCALA 1050]MDR9898157.1 AAA-like domain-containing protein [Aetokthonos hydrillicola Thurmond2011]